MQQLIRNHQADVTGCIELIRPYSFSRDTTLVGHGARIDAFSVEGAGEAQRVQSD